MSKLNPKYRSRVHRRIQKSSSSLEVIILGAIINQFQYSGYDDTVLEEPEKIRDALYNIFKDTKLWSELQMIAEAAKKLLATKDRLNKPIKINKRVKKNDKC